MRTIVKILLNSGVLLLLENHNPEINMLSDINLQIISIMFFRSSRFISRRGLFVIGKMNRWVGGLDVGTQSARFAIFDENQKCIAKSQQGYLCNSPKQGWVEQDPMELLKQAKKVMNDAINNLKEQKYFNSEESDLSEHLKALGIANQRETTILWDKNTGKPLYPAIGKKIKIKKYN